MSKRILYTVSDSPPGRIVQLALEYLDLTYEVTTVDWDNGEHFSKEFLEMYPQGEIPVLDDFGVVVGESVAIIQYLASKYPRDDHFYPKDPVRNSVVHHRLAFYLSTYYRRIHDYYVLPMDYTYERTNENLVKLNHALKILDAVLKKQNTAYAAGDKISIADLPLIIGTGVLTAFKHDLSPYESIRKWFQNFEESQPALWKVAKVGWDGLEHYNANPRNLTHLDHPIHPTNSKTEAKKAE